MECQKLQNRTSSEDQSWGRGDLLGPPHALPIFNTSNNIKLTSLPHAWRVTVYTKIPVALPRT